MGIEGVHTVSAEKSLEKKRKRSRDMRRKRSNVEMSLFLSFAFPLFCSLWRFPLSSALSFVFLPPRPRTLPPLGVALGLYRNLLHTSRRAALFTNGGAFFVVFFLALNVPRSMLFAVCSGGLSKEGGYLERFALRPMWYHPPNRPTITLRPSVFLLFYHYLLLFFTFSRKRGKGVSMGGGTNNKKTEGRRAMAAGPSG
jgi:hypothetical protein